MMNVTDGKQLDIKVEKGHHGVTDKAGGIKSDLKKTEEWEVVWLGRREEVKDRHSKAEGTSWQKAWVGY